MSKFYTSVFHQGRFIYVRGYENGRRFERRVKYQPYLFLPDPQGSFRTIDGKPASRMDFDSISDARSFLDKYKDVAGFSYYGMDRWAYPYIHDNFPGKIEYDPDKIRVMFLDIEVDSKDGYPDIEMANKKITAISLRIKETKVVFGYGEFDPPPGVYYIRCQDEVELIEKFLRVWKNPNYSPDVITGWNIAGFDVPYLVNRIRAVLSEDRAKELSPWGFLRERRVFIKGRDVQMYTPMGISILDYMDLYKKYTYNQQSSYSLNNIAYVELKEKKISYTEYSSLADLYEKNHQKFLEYNIHDVDLVYQLDQKLKFIDLVYAVAFDAKVNFADAFTSVLLWDVIIYNYLMNKGIVIPKQTKPSERLFEGAYVKSPLVGLHDWVMSFDVTSLYPKTIVEYNISPETFVKKRARTVDDVLGSSLDETGDHSVTANGCYFRRDIQGFLPALMEEKFGQRVEYQKAKKNAKSEDEKGRYDKAQLAIKIMINSLYGALANAGFRYYNADFAEAITLSGQLAIKFMEREVNAFMNTLCGTTNQDYVVAVDTDSLYVRFDQIIRLKNPDKPIDFLDKLAKEQVEPLIARKFEELARKVNAFMNAMKMKREIISDKAIFVAKKRYAMNVWDKEGERYEAPIRKIMGIETVRSSTPEICRHALETAIEIMLNRNEVELQNYIDAFRADFMKAPFEEIAFPRGMNGLAKYSDAASIYKKGTPIHVRGALLYNEYLRRSKLTGWNPIFEGDKIKFCYMKLPNPINDDVISCPGFLPFPELEPYLDRQLQYEKAFLDPLNNLLQIIGWRHEKGDSLADLF